MSWTQKERIKMQLPCEGGLTAIIEQNDADKLYDWRIYTRNGVTLAQSDAKKGFPSSYHAIRSMKKFLKIVSTKPLYRRGKE